MSLFLLLIAIYGALQLQRVHSQSESLLVTKVNGIQNAFELELKILGLQHWLDQLRIKLDLDVSMDVAKGQLNRVIPLQIEISHWLTEAELSASSEREREFLAEIQRGLSKFNGVIFEPNVWDASKVEIIPVVDHANLILRTEVLEVARTMVSYDEDLLKKSLSEEAHRTNSLVQWLLVIGVLGSVMSLLAGYGIARSISINLVQVQLPIIDVAGKLSEVTKPIIVSKSFDLADLRPALEKLFGEVEIVVNQLQKRHQEILHAEQLATAGQLAAGIAHEIRNPLMSMKLLVQHALKPGSAGIDDHDLHILDDEIRRLEMLLDDFFEFARPQQLRRSLTDICPLIESTLGLVQRLVDARQIQMQYLKPSGSVRLNIDPPRIKQVLLNLLLNAIQVTPPMGVVCLKVEQVRFDGKLVCQLQVSDDGPGLGDITEERLFEPFYSTKETGLGLGLPVSQRIVKQHGGTISFGANDRGGAMFTVVLPYSA
ncbi:two-component system sensor histidine kinase NtrB [Planctomicrobium sp. SH527]|uniref:two-component system sensor histidine kinase NtrB n=1 Tax=Planctomicrobium sp. SH527 TaxID=3448123 RepID=UPI003F5C6E90